MKESITDLRKWNLIAGGSDPKNDVVSAELCQGIEDAMRHAYAKSHPLGDITHHDVKCNVLNALQSQEIIALNARIKRLEEALEAMSKVIGPPGKSTWVTDDELHHAWALYILAKDSQ